MPAVRTSCPYTFCQLISFIIAVPFGHVNGTASVLLLEQAVPAQVIGIPLPCTVTVFIGQAVHTVIAVGDCHLSLFSSDIQSASRLSRPVSVQVIEHEGVVKQTFFGAVADGEAADVTVFIVGVSGSDAVCRDDLFDTACIRVPVLCQDSICIFFQILQPAIPVIGIIHSLPARVGLTLYAPVPIVGTGEHFPAVIPLISGVSRRGGVHRYGRSLPTRIFEPAERVILPGAHDLSVAALVGDVADFTLTIIDSPVAAAILRRDSDDSKQKPFYIS